MSGIFKAYDVRGIYPSEINEERAHAIGLAFQYLLDAEDRALGRSVVVSRDMRSHSEPLRKALVQGLRESGLDVIDIGLATTPMNYFAVGHLRACGGVQVTASHNPARYNGMKFSRHEARPVSGDHGIPLLEKKVAEGTLPRAGELGGMTENEIFDDYSQRILSFLRTSERYRPLRVVVDAANGMGTLYQPLLERMGIDLIPLYFELDGTFPNHEANPLKLENLEELCAKVSDNRADLGISFDGDADRAAFVDERGEPIGCDLITGLIAGELLSREPGHHVLYDLRSSRAVPEYITESGGIPVRERVGHSFMKATLREKQGIFGGELAGHYYFRDCFYADCSLLAVVEILNLLQTGDKPFSEIVHPLYRYAKSHEINFEVQDKEAKIKIIAERYADGAIDYMDGITVQYNEWWFNVRPSNTEPYLRLVVEAFSRGELERRRYELEAILGTPVA